MKSLKAAGLVWGFGKRTLGGPLSLEFQPNTLTAIVGPNGVGKSCLIQTLAGLIPPLAGGVEGLTGLNSKERAALIAYLPQKDAADHSYSVTDAVMAGRYRFQHGLVTSPEDVEKVSHAIEFVALSQYADTPLLRLSGGEQQRVKLARALVQETPILLMDEPNAHLDLGQSQKLGAILRRLVDDQKTVVVVTHDVEWCRRFADLICLLDLRQTVKIGPPNVLLTPGQVDEAFQLSS